jgi:hypothetical protein
MNERKIHNKNMGCNLPNRFNLEHASVFGDSAQLVAKGKETDDNNSID